MPDTPVRLSLAPDHHRGAVDRRLFGSFVEHMGRCVYTGIYEPGHPTADEHGFRARRRSSWSASWGSRVVRYPGGNFVSGYRWEDGVGPRDGPARAGSTWPGAAIETNQVGTDEFLALGPRRRRRADDGGQPRHPWRRRRRSTCSSTATHPGGTALSDLRAPERRTPSRTTCGCGAWATRWTARGRSATRPPTSTAGSPRRPREAMRLVDPSIELVACGSLEPAMPTFGAWERDRPRARLRRRRLHLAARLLRASSTATATRFLASGDGDGPLHRRRRGDRRPRRRAARRSRQADQRLLRRVERLVPVAGSPARRPPTEPRGPAAHRGRLHRRPTPWSSATC